MAAAAPAVAILLFGFFDNRFVGDFVPFLILGAVIGSVGLSTRLSRTTRWLQGAMLALVLVLGVFGVAANTAMAITPTGWWSSNQVIRFVEFQQSVSRIVGRPLSSTIVRGSKLPTSPSLDEFVRVEGVREPLPCTVHRYPKVVAGGFGIE